MLSRQQSRAIDQHAMEVLGIPGVVLMENAGRSCAEVLWANLCEEGGELQREFLPLNQMSTNPPPAKLLNLLQRQAVVICCGPGNNGGDGFVIARHLWLAGVRVKIVLVADRKRYLGDALTHLRIIENLKLELVDGKPDWSRQQWYRCIRQVQDCQTSWLVDALLGTGAQGTLAEPIKTLVEAINQGQFKRMAVDLPTGLDCDTGEFGSTVVRADLTCTFVAPKLGFSNSLTADYLGKVIVVGIGTVNPFDSIAGK